MNGCHTNFLMLSGSNDAKEWTKKLSYRYIPLNGPNENTFIAIACHQIRFSRYIKLELIESNYKGTNEIYIQIIEFFGLIKINVDGLLISQPSTLKTHFQY